MANRKLAGLGRTTVALLAAGLLSSCAGSGGGAATAGGIGSGAAWDALYWVNSNSGATFAWSLDGVSAGSYVAAALNGAPAAGATGCSPFGGAVTPGVAAKSMQDALPPGAAVEVWMQPRDQEFASVSTQGLKAAVESELAAFQACLEQDWPAAPTVSGFLCVKEQQLGGAANCDSLQQVFADGVTLSGSTALVKYGILGAPGNLNRTDVSAALGEMYEPIYFPPGDTCPDPTDGAAYGREIADWLAQAAVIPARGSVAVPAFGGPSATCRLDYDQLAPAAAALAEKAPAGLAGLAVWG